jgi:cystinosin
MYIIEVISPDLITQDWATIRLAGYGKAVITFFKYMPQVYLNFKRKSTVGWSLENVMLDFFGGFFSFA